MVKLRNVIQTLLKGGNATERYLQRINELILKDYQIKIGDYLLIRPLDVEVFYVNLLSKPPYIDTNMQCWADTRMKETIWGLQSNRLGKLYDHLIGAGGLDICLSESKEYALCCTLLAANVNGQDVYGPLKIRNLIFDYIIQEESKFVDCDSVRHFINDSLSSQVLFRREDTLTGHVYHVKRRVRKSDEKAQLALRSFMDIWNKKLPYTNQQRIDFYMQAHPSANVMEVMREHGIHSVPAKIRMKYHIGKYDKLQPNIQH